MVRQIYRMYLYFVSIALLILAAVGLGILLNTLLAYTPLRGSYRIAPTQQELVQSLVFAITAWIIAAALGALHVRLIRRDIAEYPEAGSGGVRAFFLNAAEAIGALVAVFAGVSGFSALAYTDPFSMNDSTGSFATALAALLFVAVLEMERRRFQTAAGAPAIFQRLHIFGVPLILLIVTTFSTWNEAMHTSIAGVLIQANIYSPLDPAACGAGTGGPIEGPCSLPIAPYLWLAALVPAAAIALYAYLGRDDLRSLIRTVTHIGSLCLGAGALLVGLVRGIELLMRALFGIPVQWSDIAHPWYAAYDFISPISIGVLLVVIYGLWLRAEGERLPPGSQTTRLATEAVVAVIYAAAFWWGIGRVIYTALEWFGAASGPYAEQWAGALALTIAGLVYIPLAIHLRLSTPEAERSAPRRGFILALLAGGIITGAVGLTITLYTLGTNLLGASLENWERTVRGGLAALVVGIILAVSYGMVAFQERSIASLFKRLREATAKPAAPAEPVRAPVVAAKADITAAIEQALKDYEAHTLDLHEATERIQSLMNEGPQPAQLEPAQP